MARSLRPSERTFIFAASDAVMASVAVVLALWTWSLTSGLHYNFAFVAARAWWFAAVPIWVITLSPTRHPSTSLDLRVIRLGLLHAAAALLVAYLAIYFSMGADVLPRLMALYVVWDVVLLTLGGRLALVWALSRRPFIRQVMVVGPSGTADAACGLLATGELGGAAVVARVDPAVAEGRDALVTMATRAGATEVVVAMRDEISVSIVDQLLRCQESGIDVVTFEHLYEQTLRRVPVRHVGHDWVLTQLFSGAGPRDASPIAKRVLDVVATLGLGVIGLVPCLIAGVAIVLESGRPVFYSQARLGRGGRLFRLTKFRTMRHDAEVSGPQWSPENDARITRVGRLLRRTHVDELPNLWAVLRGEMSMVGPRPERPEFVALLEREVPLYRARLIATPGLTGWAQVSTEYGDSIDDSTRKLEFDLYYVRHRSLWFDLAILGRTVGRMLGLKGR